MPRVPYVSLEDLPNQYEILEKEADRLPDYIQPEWWNEKNNIRAFGNNPVLTKEHVRMNTILWTRSGLTSDEVEVVILAVARELQSAYIWHHHIESALDRGLNVEEITALSQNDLSSLNDRYIALSEYATAVVSRTVTDDVHGLLAEYYGDDTIVGTAMLAAYYQFIDRVANALDITLQNEFFGWDLENFDQNGK